MKIDVKLVPVGGQDSLARIRELVADIPRLISYLAAKVAGEIKAILISLGMGGLASTIQADITGIVGDAEALGFVESGRKEARAMPRKFLRIMLRSGEHIWRKRAAAVQAHPVLDDAAEKIFTQTDPLDLTEQV